MTEYEKPRILSVTAQHVAELERENAKLRDELSKWERLTAGIDLPEHPVTQFKPKDLERENTKLREQLDTAEHNQTRNAREYARMCHENAKLREELAKARDPQRIGGQADPSSFVYALEQLREFRWQHATNDENAIPYINNVAAAHERENAKLRELVRDMWHDGMCECDERGACAECEYNYTDRMRELGIEVG